MIALARNARRWLAAVLVLGCKFDAGGIGHASGLGSGSDDGSTSSASGNDITSTSFGTTLGGSGGETIASTDPATGGHDDGTLESSSDGASAESESTSANDPCAGPPPFELTLEAADAVLSGTMMLGTLDTGQEYVYAEMGDAGTAAFAFATACPGQYWIWGYVYDGDPLIANALGPAADRMRVDLGSDSTDWRYGCTTDISQWSWQQVSTNNGVCLAYSSMGYDLDAGEHAVAFTPTEDGTIDGNTPGSAAALQRITITNDPDFAP